VKRRIGNGTVTLANSGVLEATKSQEVYQYETNTSSHFAA
jgi:hypothetical protein